MARQVNTSITRSKHLLASRLQYLLLKELATTSKSALCTRLEISNYTLNRLCNGISHYISLDLMLNVAEKLKLRYEFTIRYDGKGHRDFNIELAPIHPGLGSKFLERFGDFLKPSSGGLRA